jgi:uncharacterized protein (DUF58 family)
MDTGNKDILRASHFWMKSLWYGWRSRLKERWHEGIRHKVTPLGAMMVVLLLTSGILAFSTTQNVFFLLFSLLLASILISSFVNRLMLAGLELRLDLPEHPIAGEPLPCRLIVDNGKSWLASFALEIIAPVGRRFYLPCVTPKSSASIAVDVVWSKRGIPDPVIVEISTRFPFGFSIRRTRVAVPINRSIYPSMREKPGFAVILGELQNRSAGLAQANQTEFNQLREYVSGDDIRRIAWSKSASATNWLVREMTGGGDQKLQLWFDTASPEPERLIELAAYLVWELQYKKNDFVFSALDRHFEVRDASEAYNVLRLLAELAPQASELPPHDSPVFVLSLRPGYLSLPATLPATPTSSH